MTNWRLLAVLLCLFHCKSVFAQNDFSPKTWLSIDTSIEKRNNLRDISGKVDVLLAKAMNEKKYVQAIRCYNYKIWIADLRTEDSMYFKNSSVLDSLLSNSKNSALLEVCAQVILGKRLINFTTRDNRFQRQTYERTDIPVNYAAQSNEQLDSLAQVCFNKAKELSKNISIDNIDELLWLSSHPLEFLYKPDLYDLVIAEQINSNWGKRYSPINKKMDLGWIILSPHAFAAKLDSFTMGNKNGLIRHSLYSEWLNYHRKDTSTWSFIELIARKSFYEWLSTNTDSAFHTGYEHYLQTEVNTTSGPAKACAVYQLCLLWNKQADNYFPEKENLYDYPGMLFHTDGFDSTYRFHAKKALKLFQANTNLLDSFYYLKESLLSMEISMKKSFMKLELQANNLINEPILAELKFKNADSLYYRIIKLNENEYPKNREFKNVNQLSFADYDPGFSFLFAKPFITDKSIALPATGDYNNHAAYLKLDAMPAGKFAIIYSIHPLTDTLFMARPIFFAVTAIGITNIDQRVYILNRKTGMPLTGANVTASYFKKTANPGPAYQRMAKNYIVNKEGYVMIGSDDYEDLQVYYQGDTTYKSVEYKDYTDNDESDEIYTKEEYSDLIDFYDENASAYIFTDRSIYRPGQTVYYKAIFVTKNKKTGESMIMNRKNLKGRLFGSVYKKWLKEMEPLLLIKDVFGKKMDSLDIVPNSFGSVSGSFKIPKTAATGEWNIEPDYLDTKWREGTFMVEEYKRPTYTVTIEKPKKQLLPGDEFEFKIKVKSFAGAALNNVKLEYSLERNSNLPVKKTSVADRFNIDTSGYTDNKGEFIIKVNDSLLRIMDMKDKLWSFNYDLDVDAVDATGESYSAKARVDVSSRPVQINIRLAGVYERNHFYPVPISTSDRNEGPVKKKIDIRLYRITENKKLFNDRDLAKTDLWLYDKNELQQTFPFLEIMSVEENETREFVFSDTLTTGIGKNIQINPVLLTAGKYEIITECKEEGILRGESKRSFSIFDEQQRQFPQATWSFSNLKSNSLNAGDTTSYYYGNTVQPMYSIFYLAYYTKDKAKGIQYYYDEKQTSSGLQRYQVKLPTSAVGTAQLIHVSMLNNELYTELEDIFIAGKQLYGEPQIIIEKYRKKLIPGDQETFTLSVKTKDENVAAEIMTTMYDASLDELERHTWEKPNERTDYRDVSFQWEKNMNNIEGGNDNYSRYHYQPKSIRPFSGMDIWWLNPADFMHDTEYNYWRIGGGINRLSSQGGLNQISAKDISTTLYGTTAGIFFNSERLNNVIVVGYETKRQNTTGSLSSIAIRGMSSISAYSEPLVILDGIIYEGDLDKIDVNLITAGLVLKGADASSIYGARASNGVLILSTKGDIILPKEPEPEIIPRKNFSESAFFFPAIHADRKGLYSFSFTMPESVTEWNWKILAHTKNMGFAYLERKLTTQLPLMVQPNMPRLLYQGDRIILQSRISNLDTNNASGKIICKIEDEVTGDDLTSKMVTVSQHDFSIAKKLTTSSSFEIKVPPTQLNPLKIVITVRSENFADGEEHIIPVLSPAIFVRDNHSFVIKNATDTIIQLQQEIKPDNIYGIGLSIVQKPQSALINSLADLANYPYGCAEQTFNKLLANITALRIMRTDSMAQQSLVMAKAREEKEGQQEKLPAELAEETMPWLNLGNQRSLQQKNLLNLLDTSRTLSAINEKLQKIYEMQQKDGGISWFPGGHSDFYISIYLLRGFGELKKENQLIPATKFLERYQTFIHNLMRYCDQSVSEKMAHLEFSQDLYYLYARSNWISEYPLNDSITTIYRKMLLKEWKDIATYTLYKQALLCISSLRFGEKDAELHTLALNRLRSIRQLAIEDENYGMRWKDLADTDDLTNSAEETIVLIAQAFSEAGIDKGAGITKWLMTAKSEHHWSSTKATAAAIGLLSKQDSRVTGPVQTITAEAANETLSVSDDLFSGMSFLHTKSTTAPATIHIYKKEKQPAKGNIALYYFSASDKLSSLNKDVQLDKQFYVWNDSLKTWKPLTESIQLKIADKVRVVISIQSVRPLRYVYIDDKRAAAYEPEDIESGYEYNSITYYKSVRDAGFQFFTDFIPSGRHEITYELKVAQEGSFTSGPASLQCMYRPEITSYSNSTKVVIGK
ncbi:MAG: MG2 domain-containing protein [Chitinophagaceae bacterium]